MDPLDTIEAEASATVVGASVCLDGRLLAEYHDALSRLANHDADGMLEADDGLETLAEEVERLQTEVKERTHRYTFACIDRREREQLADAHPPKSKKHQDWDPEGFEPAMAAASLVEVDGQPTSRTVESLTDHFDKLRRTLPPGEHGWGIIWNAVVMANGQGTQVPPTVSGIVDRFISGLNSTTQPDEASR